MIFFADYDDEEDAWEMPNFYNETYMKEGNISSFVMYNLSLFLIFHLKKGVFTTSLTFSISNSPISLFFLNFRWTGLHGNKEDLYDRLKRHAYTGKKGKSASSRSRSHEDNA